MDQYQFGELAYKAYCDARQWKSVRGEPLPHWNQQSKELQDAWIASAKTVSDSVSKEISIATERG